MSNEKKSNAGRKLIEWPDEEFKRVERLAAIQCTAAEICNIQNISEETLNRLIKDKYDMTFREWFDKYSASGKVSLRRRQFESAESGNVSMQIWLGKNYLNQVDKVETSNTNINMNSDFQNLTVDEIKKLLEEEDET